MSALDKLLGLGGPAIGNGVPVAASALDALPPRRRDELLELSRRRDGFFAFESGLHVFPASATPNDHSVAAWNDGSLWCGEYDGIAGHVFFAEDTFGGQFSISSKGVHTFDPETGDLELVAPSIEKWASLILDDHRGLTAWPLAREWQEAHGPLPARHRLVPAIPFVLGGAFARSNLKLMDSVRGMRWRASIARQIRDLPDGAQIDLKVID